MAEERARFNWLVALPPVIGLAILAAFYVGLNRENPDELPSTLTNRPAPALDLPALPGDTPPTTSAMLRDGEVKIVNFWASWCAPCRAEHPNLKAVAQAGLPVVGVNYKDGTDAALAFLDELGNPFAAIGQDASGRTGIEWGLYGVPETFVVDGEGTVLLRYPGPITKAVWAERFEPLTGVALD